MDEFIEKNEELSRKKAEKIMIKNAIQIPFEYLMQKTIHRDE